MYSEAESDYLPSTRALSEHIYEVRLSLGRVPADNATELRDDIQRLLAALLKLKECLDYRPLLPSDDGERTWTHDLRNHLNAAKGYAELTLENPQRPHLKLDETFELIFELISELDGRCARTASSSEETEPGAHTGTILVVEDNEDNRLLLCRILRAQGHTVIEADSAGQAFIQLEEHDIELILLDLILPDQNGFEILQRLKADPALRQISVIMVSGQQDESEVIQCIQGGAEDYLSKPVNQVLLKARIDASLERKSWRDREQNYVTQLAQSHAFIRKTFGRYMSEEIVDSLLEDPHGLELGGKACDVSIIMSDICNFTRLCNELEAEQVVQLLNNYLGTLSEVIRAHMGTIDEFIGDAILAIFGAPYSHDDDADRAVQCALAMQLAMEEVNAKNRRDGLPEIETAIAINTGPVVAGNIGSEQRTKFAVVGQAVNLTARIEDITQANEILISDSTLKSLSSAPVVEDIRKVKAKGFDEPVTVYSLAVQEVSISA